MTPLKPVDRRTDPHLRRGLCDLVIERGEPTRYVEDERCHRDCADDYEGRES